MLFMVVERFKNKNPEPVRARFLERGRMLPDGLTYVASWMDPENARCFQVMEADSAELMDEWIGNWNDLIDFEIVPVLTSQDYWSNFTDRVTRS